MRELILRPARRGLTVFFSSHILSDAEALCSRVGDPGAGPTRGRRAAVRDLAFELKGWELVVADVGDALRARRCARAPAASRRSRTAATRSICRPTPRPKRSCTSLRASGAQVVSLNPVRETLEDYFVQSVRAPRPARHGGSSVRAIALVAGAVFKESVRDRVPYSMVVFAVLLIAASYLIGQLTAGQDLKIIKDLGLAAMSMFGLLIAIFIGIGLVSKEVERRSVYALLAKPVTRAAVHPRQVRGAGVHAGGEHVGR